MIKLRDILKETEEFQQLPSEIKKHFLEIISTYGQHRENMSRKSDIRQVAETLGAIADAAQALTSFAAITQMGGAVITSLAEPAKQVMIHGVQRTLL